MSNIPRILPLVGVAIVGVFAVNALSGASALPDFLSAAKAMAETAAAPGKGHKGKTATPTPAADQAMTPAPSALPPEGVLAPAVGPVCSPSATDLAKSAGLSPAELQVLQSLQTRRGQIDEREHDLDTQTQLLNAAEAKLDAKLKNMADLKSQIEALMGQADQKTQSEVDRLTLVYSKMKPADAAPLMATLDDKVRIPLAAQLETSKPKLLADILSKMNTVDAKHLTELLARRFAPVQQLAQAAAAPPAATPAAPATPPAKDAKGAKTAAATPAPDAASTDEAKAEAPKPAPVHKAAPKKIARAKPKPKPLAPKKKPVEEAKVEAPKGPQPYSALKKADDAKPAPAPSKDAKAAASATR